MFAGNTEPILRRHRRAARAARQAVTTATAAASSHSSSHSSTPAPTIASPVASPASPTAAAADPAGHPYALPCYNYFEVYPEDIGPMGNVTVTDAEEAAQWLLVGRRVSQAEAEQHGGCVQVTLPNSGKTQFLCITDSDDAVYGRGTYLPRRVPASSRLPARALKEEPSVFSDRNDHNACTEEDESASECSSASWSATSRSVRCV